MSELSFGIRVRQALDEAARVDARVAARLRAARERALAAQKPGRAEDLVLAGHVIGRIGGLRGVSLRLLLPLALLVAGLAGIYTWQQEQRAADVEELDARLLTDDLPIEAYLDRGFEAWLKKRAAR
jgi:hypothetical protein